MYLPLPFVGNKRNMSCPTHSYRYDTSDLLCDRWVLFRVPFRSMGDKTPITGKVLGPARIFSAAVPFPPPVLPRMKKKTRMSRPASNGNTGIAEILR